ncbi:MULTISPECIES: hypothetical protein [unclassified Streptomyces]|uniref:hypothetical protein n=1 Tax=unclassified Streptomyces TaxID=2593676 RepID=UPI00114CF44C|nr:MULTISPECIES: hypothetical protein [unclassified Streptomyces]MYS23349.1 hypothetical protein [Streptomyces sp. SID4948]
MDSLAGHVLAALRSAQDPPGLAAHVAQAADTRAALAAVRVLGPDVFAPALLAGAPFGPADREVVAEALRVFPLSAGDPPEAVRLGRATAALLARCGGDAPVPGPSAAGPDPGAAGPDPNAAGPDLSAAATTGDWQTWVRWMARLSPLALPGLNGPVREQAARRTLDLSRGLARSMLRRDHPTAARLARWVALAPRSVAVPGMDIAAVVTHLELCGATGARTVMNTAVARLLLAGDREPKEHGP